MPESSYYLDEFLVNGDLFGSGGYVRPGFQLYRDVPLDYDPGIVITTSGGDTSPEDAFAPPEPVLLPEVQVTPRTVPRATPTPPIAPAIPPAVVAGGAGVLGLLVPMAAGPPGTGDLPTDFRIVDNQYRPPTPPRKPPSFAEPLEPPNWYDILREPFKAFPAPRGFPDIGKWLQFGSRIWDMLTSRPTAPDVRNPETLLDEVLVTAPRVVTRSSPSPWLQPPAPIEVPFLGDIPLTADPGPGSAPAPRSTPRSNPFTGDPIELPVPGVRPAYPEPSRPPAPDVLGTPLPDVVGDPVGDSFTPPGVPAGTRPGPGNPVRAVPPNPTVYPDVADPLAAYRGEPVQPSRDQCQCEKKKPRKKRSPRTVCYRGTYVERSNGTTKKRLEQVPCESGASTTATSSRASSGRKKKLRPGQFPGLSLTGGQVVDLGAQVVDQFLPIIEDYVKRRAKKKTPNPKRRNRKAKTKAGRVPGSIYTTPFPLGD